MNTILIVGSAPDAKKWISVHADYLPRFDELVSLNNAWALLKGHRQVWYHSGDFCRAGRCIPAEKDLTLLLDHTKRADEMRPYWYKHRQGGCILLHALYRTINRYYLQTSRIGVIGCDADYQRPVTHFHGNRPPAPKIGKLLKKNIPTLTGKGADPLRMGMKNFTDKCQEVMDVCLNVGIYNLSEHRRSFLPFPRMTIQEFFSKRK